MSSPARRASFLLIAMALMAVLVALAFGLLQSVRVNVDAGTSSQRAWLAQEGALAGMQHALENIVRDYRTPGRPTILDGAWHRDFYALGRDRNQPGSATVPGADDDVRDENPLWNPVGEFGSGAGNHGNLYAIDPETKARYYEVGYYDPADRTAARFTDAAAAVPARSGGLFLDTALLRLQPATGETVDQLRRRARYRLRYAVMVNDVGSDLLINPALDVDYRDAWRPGEPAKTLAEVMADPANATYTAAHAGGPNAAMFSDPATARAFAPTELGRRLERYGDSLYNLLGASPSAVIDGSAARLVHVFKLRGSAANVARDADGWPCTFPTMLRLWEIGVPASSNSNRAMLGCYNADDNIQVGLGLYRNQDGAFALAGGLPLAANTVGNIEGSISHTLVGPQFSWRGIQRCVSGATNESTAGMGTSVPIDDDQQIGLVTPFGRAGERGARTRPAEWNHGPTDVPWVINALTAPPGVTAAMIGAYIPPGINAKPSTELYYTLMPSGSYSPCVKVINLPAALQTGSERRSRDLFTDFMSEAFAHWPAPWTPATVQPSGAAIPGHPALWPNHYSLDTRPSTRVYPGPYASCARGGQDASMLAPEDTGRRIDADSAYGCLGWDSHSAMQLATAVAGSSSIRTRGGGAADDYRTAYTAWQLSLTDNRSPATPVADATGIETPMPTGVRGDLGTWGYDKADRIETLSTASNSFFRDLAAAFSTALSVMRAHWVQVANPWTDPATSFPNGRLAAAQVDGIDDLDRLFLGQLGIDAADPSSATVAPSWGFSAAATLPRKYVRNGVTLANNVRSLVAGDLLRSGALTSAMRARAMELMLNDWRMSFLGASPDYAAAFRPLDVDGDGFAICSCYRNWSAFADDVAGVTWPRMPADAAGAGPVPEVWFSLTGCLTIGKTHYYRVITRGELWDSLLARPVSTATLESVLAVDANGDGRADPSPAAATGIADDIVVLHQRWYWNRYNGLLPTVYP